MTLAMLSTSNFDFVALGEDREHAERVMRRAWAKHRQDYRAGWAFADVAEEVQYVEIHPGMALRDGERLVGAVQ